MTPSMCSRAFYKRVNGFQRISHVGDADRTPKRARHCFPHCPRSRRIARLRVFDTRHDGKGRAALSECHRRPVGRPLWCCRMLHRVSFGTALGLPLNAPPSGSCPLPQKSVVRSVRESWHPKASSECIHGNIRHRPFPGIPSRVAQRIRPQLP